MSCNHRNSFRKNILIGILISIVGIGYAYYMMGASILPTNIWHWESAGGDNTQHYIGWLAFRQDRWHWPITYTDRINNPSGTSIVFTDSLPIFGVLFKIFNNVLPENFQYFALFILLGYILQYGFGFLLLRFFCPHSLLIPLIGSGFFLASPIMLLRMEGHESLTAHWLILASIYLYCLARNPSFQRWILPSYCLLIFLGLGIHFYLASMVLILAVATLLQIYYAKTTKALITLQKILFLLIVFVVFLYLWGYFIGDANAESGRVWSLNLNSFINSQNRGKFIPGLPYIEPDQWEGFAYLGLGVLLLLPISIVVNLRQPLLRNCSQWLPFIVLVSLLVIFALGNKVYFGENLILEIGSNFPFMKETHSILHATGRFVWPFYYALLLWILVSISRIKNYYFAIMLLVITFIIQMSDVSTLRSASMLSQHLPIIFPEKSLQEIKNLKKQTNSNYFWILPPSFCPGGLDRKDKSLLFAAVKSNLITNDYNAARAVRDSNSNDCDFIQQLKQSNQLKKDTLYAINKKKASPDFLLDISKSKNRNNCKALPKSDWLLCHRERLFNENIKL